jgi:hypothetical protein
VVCGNCQQFRSFEKIGLSREQSEAMTETLTDLVCANRDKMSEIFATKAALEKVRVLLLLYSLAYLLSTFPSVILKVLLVAAGHFGARSTNSRLQK